MNVLIEITQESALQVFTKRGGIQPILDRARKHIDAFDLVDVSTKKGRDEIRSFAAKVIKAKTYIEGIGKALADEQKEIPKIIDANRKLAKDTLDAWSDEVRKPLTDWEDAEKARIKRHEDGLAAIAANSAPTPNENLTTLRALLRVVEGVETGPDREEYQEAYARAKANGIAVLTAAIAAREIYEAEQAELAELRRKAAEQAQKDRDEALRRQAEQEATARAEAVVRAEHEKIEAAAKADREAAERRETQLKADAEAAERRAAETEARIKRETEEAQAREAAETARREADRAHIAKINRTAVDAFVSGGVPEDVAKIVVGLIAKKKIPAISIKY